MHVPKMVQYGVGVQQMGSEMSRKGTWIHSGECRQDLTMVALQARGRKDQDP